ncbi:MAG: hypothetical protein LBK58_00155 [Prevotellaceae bacterium]|jgi:hypothetical protein|nr:hypothetical protein [Prevotellaceae bacterium]
MKGNGISKLHLSTKANVRLPAKDRREYRKNVPAKEIGVNNSEKLQI